MKIPVFGSCPTVLSESQFSLKAVVLGELDDIGMTFVITNPDGLYWNGHHVPSAEPGIKFTLLQKI